MVGRGECKGGRKSIKYDGPMTRLTFAAKSFK